MSGKAVAAGDVLRVVGIAALCQAIAHALPRLTGESSVSSVFNMLLLFSFLSGFFINRALERRKTLMTAVEVELSRLRRLYNFREVVSDAVWGMRLRETLDAYHAMLAEDLLAYGKARDLYRTVAQHVYRFDPKTRRDELLFEDLLHTTRDIALERRPLERAIDTRMSGYGWAVYLMIAASVGILLLLNRGNGLTPLSVGLTLAGVTAVVDLLYRTDRLSPSEVRSVEEMYRQNPPEA